MGNYYNTKESVEEYIRIARGHDFRMLFGDYFDQLLIQFYKEFEKSDSFLYIGKKREGLSP
jgi:hypothetical protein